jgi:hypothetical protein
MTHGTDVVSTLHDFTKPIKPQTEKRHKSKLLLNKWGKQKVVHFLENMNLENQYIIPRSHLEE